MLPLNLFLRINGLKPPMNVGWGGEDIIKCLNLLIVLYFTSVLLLGIVEAMDIIIISIQIC